MAADDQMDLDTFRDFVAKVGAELGMQLDPDSRPLWGARLIAYDGLPAGQGALLAHSESGRLAYSLTLPKLRDLRTEISPDYPPAGYPFPDGPTRPIGVCISRGPHVVAGQIRARLEPEVLATLVKITEYAGHEADLARRRADLAGRVAALFPACRVRPSPHDLTDRAELHIYGQTSGEGGWVRVSRAASEVQFDRFTVPAEVACQILAVFSAATVVRCPDWPQPGVPAGCDLLGCGSVNVSGPDDDGWYDCETCGLTFRHQPPPPGYDLTRNCPGPPRENLAGGTGRDPGHHGTEPE
jgi:hypothetical protein